MPKELVCVGKQTLAWREYEERALAPDEIRIRSQFSAAKHGTEMSFFKGYGLVRGRYDDSLKLFDRRPAADPYGPRGFGVGNMAVGGVVEVGSAVRTFAVGDRALVHGNFRETHTRRADQCWKLTPSLSWKSAVCLDPADFAFSAVRDGHVRLGDSVAVLGLGAIGLMAVQLARVGGAGFVIASDPIASRRQIAIRLGADLVLDSHGCDVGLEIKKATAGRGADVIIDYSGSPDALQDALRGVAYGGTVVAGAYPPVYPAGLDFGAESHMNLPTMVFTRACSEPNRDFPRWDERRIQAECLRLFAQGHVTGEPIVSPVVPFEELAEVYPRIPDEPDSLIKLGAEH